MNPFELFTIAVSGLLVLGLTATFINNVTSTRASTLNRVDLLNIINIYERGLGYELIFNATYHPVIKGELVVTENSVSINNESMPYEGLEPVSCEFKSLLISERGVNCLNQ
ncbi:hypothetical protein GF352_00100 [archaeon]|nr:hypothetical protein [archaeon]